MKNQNFESVMEKLAVRHDTHRIFSDFLTLVVCAFSLGKEEEKYLSVIQNYNKQEASLFAEALAKLVIEMTGDDGTGLIDVLGSYFQEHISFGRNGQFFSPQHICDMIACMTGPVKQGNRILDPACGSGRMLLAAAKSNRNAMFYGADVDENCAKMTVINLYLNCLYGEVAWMDSLSNKFYGAWEILPTIKGIPCIRQIPERESYINLQMPYNKKEIVEISQKQLIFEF
jgi:type I restriction-modification system DNA methylase subunit